jgi:hypothetical protein
MFGQTKPLTVSETIAILAKLPADSLLRTDRYTDDYSIVEGTHVEHLSDISDDGKLTFFSDADYFVGAEREDEDDNVDADGVKLGGEVASEPEDSLSRAQTRPSRPERIRSVQSHELADWEREVLDGIPAVGK